MIIKLLPHFVKVQSVLTNEWREHFSNGAGNMKRFITLLFILSLGVVIPSSNTLAFTSMADDVAKAGAKLIQILAKYGKVIKNDELIIKMGKNIDEFLPYMRQLPKDERVKLLLNVAEENKVIKGTDKIRYNRQIVQGNYTEDELINAIKVTQKTRSPINSKYAGGVYSADDLAKKSPELAKKYPNGVRFSDDGYPDFEPYAKTKVTSDKLSGDRLNDAKLANKEAGYDRTPEGYVWHHHENCKTILLVPLDLHDAVRHSGGAEKLLKGGERCPL